MDRLKTDIGGLDALMTKGILRGSTVLVEGGAGSGKTLLCLQITKNMCEQGKRVLYMSFEEPPGRLKHHMASFGWKPEEYEKKGLLRIQRFDALDVARSVEALLSAAKKELLIAIRPVLFPNDFEPDILVMDSLTSISSAFSGEQNRFRIYMEQLYRYLEVKDITSFLIREVSIPSHVGHNYVESGEAVSFLSDGIVVLYNVIYNSGDRKCAIEIVKLRGDRIEKKIVELEITPKGLVIYPEKKIGEIGPKCKLT